MSPLSIEHSLPRLAAQQLPGHAQDQGTKVRYLDTSGPSMARRSTRPWERRHLLSTDWGVERKVTKLFPELPHSDCTSWTNKHQDIQRQIIPNPKEQDSFDSYGSNDRDAFGQS